MANKPLILPYLLIIPKNPYTARLYAMSLERLNGRELRSNYSKKGFLSQQFLSEALDFTFFENFCAGRGLLFVSKSVGTLTGHVA